MNENEEETIKELLENNKQLIKDVMDPINRARWENFRAIREHIHHYVLLSLAILGFTVPVLADHSKLINNLAFLLCSMAALIGIVVYGMWYLTHKLQKDNNDLTRRFWTYSNLILSRRIALDKMIQERTHEAASDFVQAGKNLLKEAGYEEKIQEQKESNKVTPKKPSDYVLDIIFWLFVAAIIFYILALVPCKGTN